MTCSHLKIWRTVCSGYSDCASMLTAHDLQGGCWIWPLLHCSVIRAPVVFSTCGTVRAVNCCPFPVLSPVFYSSQYFQLYSFLVLAAFAVMFFYYLFFCADFFLVIGNFSILLGGRCVFRYPGIVSVSLCHRLVFHGVCWQTDVVGNAENFCSRMVPWYGASAN